MTRKVACASIFAFVALAGFAQTARSVIGTVSSVDPQSGELSVKPDNGEPLTAKISSDALLQRVAPGERDLKKAERIQATGIAPGDRVLLSIDSATNTVRRIIVMSAADIGKRNQADRQDWIARGISGVVTAKKSTEVSVAIKSAGSEKTVVVTLTPATVYRRYAPDSVRFADAKPSKPEEIQIGDQLRARGQKSPDGSTLAAEEVVFGTFLTKAGSVASVDAASKEIHLTELGTGKPLVVKLTADTTIKAMPDVGGGAPPSPGQRPPARGPAAPGAVGPRGGRGGAGFAPSDPAEMIDRLPPATIDAVKPGQSIVVLSTKGTNADELTAITLVANAQTLIQMATPRSGGGRGGERNQDGGDQGLSPGGLGGLDLSGVGLSGVAP